MTVSLFIVIVFACLLVPPPPPYHHQSACCCYCCCVDDVCNVFVGLLLPSPAHNHTLIRSESHPHEVRMTPSPGQNYTLIRSELYYHQVRITPSPGQNHTLTRSEYSFVCFAHCHDFCGLVFVALHVCLQSHCPPPPPLRLTFVLAMLCV